MKLIIFFLLVVSSLNAVPLRTDFFKEKPKLILVLVVDQLRSDYLTRFRSRFLSANKKGGEVGGFEYLLSKGAYFPFGSYDALQNMTGPGHATILSGAYPYQTGVTLNNWFDSKTGQMVYCVQDESKKTLGASGKKDWGTSPKNLWASTLGDELKNTGYPSKVVAVALKDRSAILMGGHRADAAFWLDSGSFKWVSSENYFPDGKLPAWLEELNKSLEKRNGQPSTWKTSGPSVGLSSDNSLARLDGKMKDNFLSVFPHPFKIGSKESLSSPLGNEVTVEAVEKILNNYQLGQGKATDILAVSFSSHDYAGHAFGPNSLEMEEMTLSDDRSISAILNLIQKKVPGGLKSVNIVLTADHGIPPSPELVAKAKLPAGRIDENLLQKNLNTLLAEKFGKAAQGEWISAVVDLNIFFNPHANTSSGEDKKATKTQLEETVKQYLKNKVDGISQVFSLSDYTARRLPAGLWERQILKSYIPERSGDVVGIVKPFYFSGEATTTHMTGYSYDRTVPIVFAGPKIKPGLYAEPAEVVDIAPTLSFILGIVAPAVSEGKVLSQILQ